MAYFRKLKTGNWSAQIDRAGVRTSQTFPTKAAAQAWATKTEAEILAKRRGQTVKRTLRQALERYRDDVSVKKRGKRWEEMRIGSYLGEFGLPFADKWLEDVTPDDFAKWRDHRLKGLKSSSVARDFTLLSSVMSIARDEWGWLHTSPLTKVKRPKQPPARTRLIHWTEIRAMLRALGWARKAPDNLSQQAAHAFLVSLHTGMRAGEVLKAERRGTVATLETSKNGEPRDIPLSGRAIKLMSLCPKYTVSGPSLDALFRKARKTAGLEGFTFHDARATALTRMAKKVDVLQLARISGHKDIKMLMVYYRETSADIAKNLR